MSDSADGDDSMSVTGTADRPSAETIVFLHGGGIGPWMWNQHISQLQPFYHCLAPELPGHGSQWATPFSFEVAAQQVATMIRTQAHGGKAHLVGLSLGGQLALSVAAEYPELVDRLVVSGANTGGIPGMSIMRPMLAVSLPLKQLKSIQRLTIKKFHVPPDDVASYLVDNERATVNGLTAIVGSSGRFRIPARLKDFGGLTLVTLGSKELGLMHRSAARVVAELPRASGRVATGMSHVWPLENPRMFSDTVRAWLTDTTLPDGLAPISPKIVEKVAKVG